MFTKLKGFLLLLFCFFLQVTIAQNNDFNPFASVVPISPTVSSLAKYGDIPVGLHTGTPEVSIPIYTLQSKNISVPISLSYHASGIRVEEMASWVGLGWSLNAGGVITRTIRGKPDEDGGGYIQGGALPPLNANNDALCTYFNQDVEGGQADAEPDIFYFSVNGYSGEFFFDQNGIAYTVPYQNIQIVRLDGSGNEILGQASTATKGFKITTPDGFQYIFGLTGDNGTNHWESNTNSSRCTPSANTNSQTSVTSWHLFKIIHPNRGEVRFNYSSYLITYENNVSETRYMRTSPNGSCNSISISPTYCYSQSLINIKLLTSIETEFDGIDYGKITFEHETGRQDLDGGVRLKKINILGADGSLLKYFELNHDYFSSGGSSSDFDDYRLRLTSVQEFSANGIAIPAYQLEYIQGNFFPNRYSKDQDHWGYYNYSGGGPNTTLIPPHTYGTQTVGSANREPDENAMQAGALKKIIYPTGGSTTFKYEANSVPVNITTEVVTRTESSTATCVDVPVTQQTPFTILENSTIVQFNPSFNTGSNPIVLDYYAQVYESSNPGTPLLTFNINNAVQTNLTLDAGNYYLETFAAQPGGSSTIVATWQEEIPLSEPIYEKIVGGLRIKKITDFDGLNPANNKVRFFNYDATVDSITSSSGVLNRLPIYEGTRVVPIPDTPIQSGSCTIESFCLQRTFSSVSNIPLMYKSGNVVGYRQVQTIYPGNGSTLTKFTVAVDNGINTYPYPPFISANWKKGLVVEQIDYDEGGGEVRKITNEYTFDENSNYGSARGIAYGWTWVHPNNVCQINGVPCREFAAEFYERKSAAVFLDRTTETIDGVSVVKEYTYDTEHLNPLTITFTNSDGKQHITERTYAKEANMTCLFTKHMDNTLVKEIRKVNGAIVGGIETSFRDFNGQCLPEYIYEILEGGTPLLRTTLDFYPDGNIKNYTKRGFAPETYTWSIDLLQTRNFLNFDWSYTYYPNNRQLHTITDIKGLTSTFKYDQFQRLKRSESRGGGLFARYKYHYTLAGGGDPNYVEVYTNEDDVTRYNYIDGLGRELQTLSLGYGPGQGDVVHGAVEYDEFGRVQRQFQPHPGSGTYNLPGGPHDRFDYESSPLSRELKRTFADGSNMQTTYASNTAGDAVTNYQTGGTYPSGELYKVTILDEKGHPTITFKDKIGRVILIRKKWDGNNVDTYYQYDDRDNLIAVMPPGCSSPTDIHVGYQYSYDERNRMETKKLPGAGTQTFSYNDRDEVTSSIDGNGNVVGYEYDGHGRDTLTLLQKPSSQQAVPIIYKQYDGNGGGSMGELVSENKSILNGSSSTAIQTSYSYDEYGRVRRMQDGAYRGGSDNFEYTYEAATDRVSQIIRNYGQFGWQERYLYDHVGREKVQLHKMTRGSLYDSPTTTARASEYDIKDQLISKSLDYLQNIGYGYDLRGRLIQINKLPLPYDDSYAPIECGGSGGSPPPPPPPNGTACGGQEVGLEDLLDIIASDETPEIDCPTGCVEEEQPEICDFTASGAGHAICGIEDANGINVTNYNPPLALDDPTAATTLENDLQTFLTTYNFVYDALSVTIDSGGITVSLTGTNFNMGGIDVCLNTPLAATGNCQRVDGFPVGTPGQVAQQQASMQTLSGVMANTTVNTVQYPTTLYKVNLYERKVAFVLESETNIIEGEQTTDDCVEIETPTTIITFNQEDNLYQKSFSEVLQLRQGNSLDDSRFEGDSDCENELPKCSLIETYDAKVIQSSQVITSALPGPPPYYDLSAEPGHQDGVTINDRLWTANNIAYGECGWDVSFRTGGSNVNVLAYKVKIKGTANPDAALPPGKIRLALHNGLDFLEINEGNGTFNFFDTNGQLGEITLTVADSQYISPYQLENLVLSMHVESTEFTIDGVEVEIEYEAPCEACSEEGVPCSPDDRAAQQIDVENLQNTFQLANAAQYTYPITLHQVAFCDGTQLYVLDNELSTISGPYAIFQDISIDSSGQTLSTYIGTMDSLMTFANFIELRKTNNNLTLDSPGCPVSVAYDQENFCGYKLEMEGASYTNIPNSNQVKVSYTEVIKEQCGSSSVIEHSRGPAETIIAVQKKATVGANQLVVNQGHLKDLTLNTLNPSGNILIDLNPNTAGSGINNFDPNDLRFNGNIDVLLAAIRRVIDHEIEAWKVSNGVNILLSTYDLRGGINSTTGEGYVQISFSLYHQPTDAYVALNPGAAGSLTYSRDGADHVVAAAALSLSQEQINISSGNAPCPAVSATYFDNVIDDQNVSFNQIPVVTVEPTPTRSYGADCSSGSPTLVSACDRPKRLWNGTEYEECDYCTPDPPVCSVADTEAQQAYVDSLKNLYTTIDTSDLILPDSLHQVMLCDGTITYIFGQHLEDIPGSTTTIQTIPVGSTGQTFEVGRPDTTDLFAMRLYYEPNGNVEKVRWQVKFQPEQQYVFKYDDLDRMEESTYSGQGWLAGAAYSENVTYKDGRGNIQTLTRSGYNGSCSYVLIDDLVYTYDQGNKVIRIEDQSGNDRGFKYKPGAPGDEYRYDANGNMVYDWHKGIDTIGYNYLNLPGSIILGGAPLDYIYDAAGKKHRSPGPYDFVNNVHYSPDGFEAVYTDEGRVVPIFNDSLGIIDSFRYEWVMRDHLGNGRVYFSDLDKNLGISSQTPQEVLQERHYYPFGLMFEGPFYAQVGPENEYTYNGKRFHREGDLNWYDYGLRWYDATIARFPSLDPIADKFPHVTPYNYAENNPASGIDWWGLQFVPANERPKLYEEGYRDWVRSNPDVEIRQTIPERLYRLGKWAGVAMPTMKVPIIRSGGSTIDDVGSKADDLMRAGSEVIEGFSKTETSVIKSAKSILDSDAFQAGIEGMKNGEISEKVIDGVTVVFQADGPFSGLTLFGEEGFIIGKEALKSSDEITSTVLQETFRLNTSASTSGNGVGQQLITEETNAAFEFAKKALGWFKEQ